MVSPTPQYTDFSKDVLGRYVCNGLDEALASTHGPGTTLFDIIIIGGGSFGGTLAQHLLYRDSFRNHRILVLDAGPQVLTEHVQNVPALGLFPPGPVTSDPGVPRAEIWGIPWRSNVPIGFPGLAYCLGGRSIFWGGWSPELLEAETPAAVWPTDVLNELRGQSPLPYASPGYFRQAAEQIGVTETNDFVFGKMHEALRQQIFDGIGAGKVPDAIPLAELPQHLDLDPGRSPAEAEQRKLEAPLAVQGRPPRSGFFPLNKFSAMPLLMKAARQAQAESDGDDRRKRVMVVPNCHVTGLQTIVDQGIGRVVAVHVGGGPSIPVPDRGVVVLAAGVIESARLALLSFGSTLGYELIGTNLLAHSRSNYTFRIPREALQDLLPNPKNLEASALFVKGRKTHPDGSVGHFHLQITAAGCRGLGTNSEAELQQKIPDIDTIDNFRDTDDDHVVLTLRGVGELQARNPANRVTLSAETDEFGTQRAFVQMGNPRDGAQPGETAQTANDRDLWDAMDTTADDVRNVIVGASTGDDLARNRDGLGTSHHEAGTLWMGTDPTASVTTPNARFHHVVNAYAIGPALLPTIGSASPMLSGVALTRRLADHLVAPLPPPAPEPGFQALFDGTAATFELWQQAGPGTMSLDPVEDVMVAHPASEFGLLWYAVEAFADFVLRLQFRIDRRGDNSGVFVRFRDPRLPLPPPSGPPAATNPAWGPVHTGFEIQIEDAATPDGADKHRTGAVYDVDVGTGPGQQAYRRGSALQPGEWNNCEVTVVGDTYTVRLNDLQTTTFTNPDAGRGIGVDRDPNSGFVGLQQHTGAVAFRAVRIKKGAVVPAPPPVKQAVAATAGPRRAAVPEPQWAGPEEGDRSHAGPTSDH
ncbi:MAG: family 16 glycoside hydrolase [Pseudonocardiaceae bacterium]